MSDPNFYNINNSLDRKPQFTIQYFKIKNKTIIFLIIIYIISLILYSIYQSIYDENSVNINIYVLIFINIILTLGGLLITIIGNYITEKYTLQLFDTKLNNLSNKLYEQSKKTNLYNIVDKIKIQ